MADQTGGALPAVAVSMPRERAKALRRNIRGQLGPLAAAAALVLGAAMAVPAPARAALPFKRCPDAKKWECATLAVPLDRTGSRRGEVDLAVRRYRPPATPDPSAKPPFVALAGGPGESAISAKGVLRKAFAGALPDYQLIVYDQRGTGRSGVLSCRAIPSDKSKTADAEEAQFEATRRQVARCAKQVGLRRAYYTTLDSVADIDALRRALGAPRIGIGGISYGTYVSAVYAQQHPATTDRIVLDSVVSADGSGPFDLSLFGAVPRLLRNQCEAGACDGVTPTPRGDLARVVGKTRNQDDESRLLNVMLRGDLDKALRAGQPASFRAAARGDQAPLERLERLAGVAGARIAARGGEEGGPGLSLALLFTTRCTDARFPWSATTPPGGERDREFRNALDAIRPGQVAPFGRPAIRGVAPASNCLLWPLTDSAAPPDHPPFPDVPTLIVNGTADLRTPIENAIAAKRDFAPGAELVLVEGQGHSVLANTGCARKAMRRFFADRTIGDPCGDVDEADPVEPLPPTSIRNVKRAPRTHGKRGRTLGAALATIADLRWLRLVEGTDFFLKGLRGGRADLDALRGQFRLRRYAYVPRVRLSGKLRRHDSGRLSGALRVGGRRAVHGVVKLRPNGKVVGRLGGRRLVSRDTSRGQ